ncbi:hypothetical protein EV424DRAFT_1349456 [Suillus variegatus]|nr:hypothetical protein EV424DRAFT_1349456 [Suillus variegatus]
MSVLCPPTTYLPPTYLGLHRDTRPTSRVAAAGIITHNFIFGSIDEQRRVEAQLTDIPLDNDDYGSVGVQTWGAASVLAEMILEDPERFGLLNVLELGAGTGLINLVVMKLLDALPSFNHPTLEVAFDEKGKLLAATRYAQGQLQWYMRGSWEMVHKLRVLRA